MHFLEVCHIFVEATKHSRPPSQPLSTLNPEDPAPPPAPPLLAAQHSATETNLHQHTPYLRSGWKIGESQQPLEAIRPEGQRVLRRRQGDEVGLGGVDTGLFGDPPGEERRAPGLAADI